MLQGAPSDARYEEDARLREAMVKAAGTDQAGKAWEVLKDDPAAQDRLLEALGVSHQAREACMFGEPLTYHTAQRTSCKSQS